MNDALHLMEMLHERIKQSFGSEYSDEYFCLLQRGKPLQTENGKDQEQSAIHAKIMLNDLLNVICPPYHLAERVLPTTLSNRWKSVLSMWTTQSTPLQLQKSEQANWDQWLDLLKEELQQPRSESSQRLIQLLEMRLSDLLAYSHTTAIGETELQEAKALLKDMQYHLPDHQSVYPIHCQPNDWLSSCTSAFQKSELLPSLSYLFKKARRLTNDFIRHMEHLLPYETTTAQLKVVMEHYRQCRKEYETLPFLDNDDKLTTMIICFLYDDIKEIRSNTWKFLLTLLPDSTKQQLIAVWEQLYQQRTALLTALSQCCMKQATAKEHMGLLKPLKDTWKSWLQCKEDIKLANRRNKIHMSSILPSGNYRDYEAIMIKAAFQALSNPFQAIKVEKEERCMGLSALFAKRIPYGIKEEDFSSLEIEISFLSRRIEIEYPWLLIDVFRMSKYYQRFCPHPISKGRHSLKNTAGHELLGAYPSAFMIGKDVTLRFHYDVKASVARHIKRHLLQGNSLLCFPLPSPFILDIEDSCLTVRCPGAFLMGYFMRFTPKDRSKLKKGGMKNE